MVEDKVMFCGFTLKELNDTYRYDPEEGRLYSVSTGKSVGYYSDGCCRVSKRTVHKITSLRVGPLCWFLHYKRLPEGDIWYHDEDCMNIKINNLFVAKRGAKRPCDKVVRKSWVQTPDRRILYNELKSLWCVRRGKKDAVYWCKSLEEAIFVRNEWESDKTVQRRDFYQDKYR